MESKIIQIAHLVEFLTKSHYTAKEKITEIKSAIADGTITNDEGFDLLCEYV